jgi:hypothetical protein
MKITRIALVVVLMTAPMAFGSSPRLAIEIVNVDGTGPAETLRTDAVARLLGHLLSPDDATVTPVSRSFAEKASSCRDERGAAYHRCVFFGSQLHTDGRSVAAAMPPGVDALLVCVFSKAPTTSLYEGVYYLLARGGVWKSSSFRVHQVPDGRLIIQAMLAAHAAQEGLDVAPVEPFAVPVSPTVSWYANAVVDAPLELR